MNNALTGGLIGALAGPAGALVGASIGNGMDASDAAQNTANAQLAQANANRVAATTAANPTVAELEQMHSNYQAQNQNLSRQEALLATYDPAYMEANKQLLQNLRGQSSALLKPMQDQRAQQRSDLVNSLRSQMGEGAESSSAGISALNKFDMDSASLVANAQQNIIGQLMNYSASGVPNVNQTIQQGNQNIAAEQNQQGLYINAVNSNPVTPYSGAPFAGAAAQAASTQNLLNAGIGLAGTIGGAALTGGASAAAPAATGTAGLSTGEIGSLGANLKNLNNGQVIGD